ncbi:MAG: hypothetical protein R3B82_28280 [Sandaracinaceae bacterium]
MGNNAFLGPASTVADIDNDGTMEVIAGNTVYDGATGAEVWTFDYGSTSGSPCGGSIPCDGFNAIGNFDDDPEAEVVIIRRGEAFVINHDGTLLHRVTIPRDDVMPYLGDGPCAEQRARAGRRPWRTSTGTGCPDDRDRWRRLLRGRRLRLRRRPAPRGLRAREDLSRS